MPNRDPKLTRIAVMEDSILAEVLRGLLEAEEIPCMLTKEGIGHVYGLHHGYMAEVEIFVPQRHEVRARQIYRDNFGKGED
ncbi:MAG: DUF2007 domain-containing protein [Anaerolineales bacterium]|nr:DUF2007 domain-containing protein [Anaerolineales bacterium]